MSEALNGTLANDEDLDMEFLQFEAENYNYQEDYQGVHSADDLQEDAAETGALSLGQLQQEVIDEHENFLLKLTRMVELERQHVDDVYRGHEPAVSLNQKLHEEIAAMKERVDQAVELLAKMQALLDY